MVCRRGDGVVVARGCTCSDRLEETAVNMEALYNCDVNPLGRVQQLPRCMIGRFGTPAVLQFNQS